MPGPEKAASRVMRIFISSTFRDMQLEREELIKRVFPRIRRRCEQRGVKWSVVDLRWGVTDEQKADGEVLPICLAEIERTRPYFIGLLGQRYGWVPDSIPVSLTAQMEWLTEIPARSVTELEILHGVLNHPEVEGHAHFYLRDPAWVAVLPENERAACCETDPKRIAKLNDLKQRVRGSGHPVRDYDNPMHLGELVLADLTALVDRLYPESLPTTPLARQAAEHCAFAASRLEGFIERSELMAQLNAHVSGTGPPLLVTAESGGGASVLVAGWARAWRSEHPDDLVLEHYVGANPAAATWQNVAARLNGELARAHGTMTAPCGDFPNDLISIRSTFADAFKRAADQRSRTVLVLDAVDCLVDECGAPDLLWLPVEVPSGVRMLLTTIGGRPLEAATHRGWPVLEVSPLTATERRRLVVTFLAQFSKALDEQHIARLVAAPLARNPLYLRTVLDELRQHGDHFTLGERISAMLEASTVDDLLEQVLARYERDYERDRPGLVHDAFTVLWAAQRGLTEAELLDILGAGSAALPHAIWSPLFIAAEQELMSRSGLLGFVTNHMRTAVADRYLTSEAARATAHAKLGTYFASRRLDDRVVDELPWHQLHSGDLDGLARTLGNLDFTELAFHRDFGDLRRLWARAEAAGHRILDAYRSFVDDPAAQDAPRRFPLISCIALLLADGGYPEPALRLQRYLVEQARIAAADPHERTYGAFLLRSALVSLGHALWRQGDLADADAVLVEAAERCRGEGDRPLLAVALGNLAAVRLNRGELESAAALFTEEESLHREQRNSVGLRANLANQAQLLRQLGRYGEALTRIDEEEQLCRELADTDGTARVLASRSMMLNCRVTDALIHTVRQGQICRDLGDLPGLAESLLDQATLQCQLACVDAASSAASEAEGLARRLANPGLLARALVARAQTACESRAWPAVENFADQAERLGRKADDLPTVTRALSLLGAAQCAQRNLSGSRATHEEELRVATATGDPEAIAVAHCQLANCDVTESRLESALAHYTEADPVLRRLRRWASLLRLLANRAQIHLARQDLPAAVADYAGAAECAAQLGLADAVRQWGEAGIQLAYRFGDTDRASSIWASLATAYRDQGDDEALQRALGERAFLLIQRAQRESSAGDVDPELLTEAEQLLDEQESICRRISHQVGLAACLGNQAIVLRHRGDLKASLVAIDQQLVLAQTLGNAEGALLATANRGEVLGLLGRTAEGLEALHRARTTAADRSPRLQSMVQQLDQLIATLEARQ